MLRAALIFYRKLVIPSMGLAFLTGLISLPISGLQSFLEASGISYMFYAPLFHYFIYEVKSPKEYYFYYNLGLSRKFLWIFTLLFSIFMGAILT